MSASAPGKSPWSRRIKARAARSMSTLLIQPGFFGDAPAKIDGLEAKARLLAELRQLGPNPALQGVLHFDQIGEGGADVKAKSTGVRNKNTTLQIHTHLSCVS